MKPSRALDATVTQATESHTTATRIGRNFSFRLVAQIASSLINVGGMVLLGNYLHAEGYGQYAYYYALIALIGSLGDLGVGIIVTKDVARDPANGQRTFGDALIVKSLVSGVLFAGIAGFAFLRFEPGHALLICLVAATAFIELAQDASIWMFRAHERQDVEALLLLASQVVWLGGLAAGVLYHWTLPAFIAAASVAFLLRFGIGAILVTRMLYPPVFQFDAARLRTLVLQGLPFAMAMFGVVLYGRIGILMLEWLSTPTEVAHFNVGYMLSQPLGFISTALSMAAFPVLARYAQSSPEAMRGALRKTSKYQLVVTLPAMVGLYLVSDRVVPLLFHGADFDGAGVGLKLMSLGLAFIFLNLMSRYVLAAIDRQHEYLRAIVVGLVVNAGLCALLIPRAGFVGACFAFLGAELAILIVCQNALARYVTFADLARETGRPLVAALGMGAVVLLLQGLNLFVVIPVAAVVYVAMLFALRAFSPQEIEVLRGVYTSFRLPGSTALSRRRSERVPTSLVRMDGESAT